MSSTETVDLEFKNRIRERLVDHADVFVSVSPSENDIPQAATVVREPTRIFISFKYIDKEESKQNQIDKYLTLWAGKNSEKVLGLELKLDPQQIQWGYPEGTKQRLARGMESCLAHATRDNQRMNYQLVLEVIDKYLTAVLARLEKVK
jgi:hypothetical protein